VLADKLWMPQIVRIAVIATVLAAGGCSFGRKPYANDPLIRANRAVWGDRDKAQTIPPPVPEPAAPQAPAGPLIGSEIYVTSPP
jgi:hypothetical protein